MSPQDQRVAPAIGSFEREPKPGTQQPYGGAGERANNAGTSTSRLRYPWLADTLPCGLHQNPPVAAIGAWCIACARLGCAGSPRYRVE